MQKKDNLRKVNSLVYCLTLKQVHDSSVWEKEKNYVKYKSVITFQTLR